MKFKFRLAKECEFAQGIQSNDWNDWRWQLRHSAQTLEQFLQKINLTADEQLAFASTQFNIRATPYYLSLVRDEPEDPIRKIVVPHAQEMKQGKQQMLDPLGERKNNPVNRIVHRYSDRVLFLVTDMCSVYCRYCTRKHFTGQEQNLIERNDYEKALEYIRQRPGIREVILSGGDPLTLGDNHLIKILSDLRRIDHVEIIRIGTRMPVVCPMRVTDDLVKVLRDHKPVFLMTHFNHPRELTAESAEALEKFVDHGVPVMNQMVLLNGVNNHAAIVQALNRRLLYLRVKPYYMFQCDPSEGTDHLRTSVADSMAIQRELWGHLSGLAMPTLSLDIPNGGGKVSLVPNFLESAIGDVQSDSVDHGNEYRFVGWDGVRASYVDPDLNQMKKPIDAHEYQQEFDDLKSAKFQSVEKSSLREI